MGLNEEVAILSTIPLFSKIAMPQLKLIAFSCQRVIFPDGQEIFRQGEAGDCAYIFLSGCADVFFETPEGSRKISSIRMHQITGEVAVLADVPRTATVRATGEVVALKLEKDVLLRIMEDFPDVAIKITRLLAWRLHNTIEHMRTDAPVEPTEGTSQ